MPNPTGKEIVIRSPGEKSDASSQPHDALFRWTFSRPEHAAGLLRAALPASLVAEIDFSTLRLEKGSYVSRALRHRHSDLVFSVRLRESRLYFYVLMEHQSRVEPLMIVRMGIYMMRLWEELLREHADLKQIPAIYPILVHNGAGGWTAATAFQDVVALDDAARPALLPYTPCFQAHLIDLHEGVSANLVPELLTALGRAALWLMSVAGDDERLRDEIGGLSTVLTEVLRAPDAASAMEVFLRYLSATHRRLNVDEIADILEEATGPEGREVIVTVLDEIEERGRTEGLTQGRAQALQDLLAARFGRVPPKAQARIRAADEATLARWTVRVLSAPTLKDVLDDGAIKARPVRKPAARRR